MSKTVMNGKGGATEADPLCRSASGLLGAESTDFHIPSHQKVSVGPRSGVLFPPSELSAPPPLMKLFGARIDAARFVVVPNAGHSTYREAPDVFTRTLLDFIRETDRRQM